MFQKPKKLALSPVVVISEGYHREEFAFRSRFSPRKTSVLSLY